MEGWRLLPEVAMWVWSAGARQLLMGKIMVMPPATKTSPVSPLCPLPFAALVVAPVALFAKFRLEKPPLSPPSLPMIVAEVAVVVAVVVVVLLLLGCSILVRILRRLPVTPECLQQMPIGTTMT